MDFHELMHVAASKQEAAMKKTKRSGYNFDLSAPKREEKSKSKSETVQRLIQEKEREKREKERKKQEKEQKEKEERDRKEKEERKRNQFRIPKKKPELASVDKQQLIDSLFDDGDGDSPEQEADTAKRKDPAPSQSSSSSSSSKPSSSQKNSAKDSSTNAKDHSSSHSSHKSSSSLEGKKSHSSSKENHSSSQKSSSSKHQNGTSSSSSSSKHSSNHSLSKHRKEESSSSKHDTKTISKNHQKSETTSSKTDKQPSSASSHSSKSSASDKNPIPLNKNHLNPILERHAENPQLTEKAKILARLQAIKERTMAAIAKENEGKGKRVRGVQSQRKSKNEDMNNKAKSAEIVKDIVSSDEEDGNDQPSALDIMLSERNAKLEKEKIARMAKQAWDRATKGDSSDETKSHRDKKRKLDRSVHRDKRDKSFSHKVKGDGKISLSSKSSYSKQEPPRPKKPVIVRHANNAPPPMDFKDILAIAEKKSKEPLKPVTLLDIPKKKKEEPRRPMTQEEKDRIERRKSKEYQNWLKYGGERPKDNRRTSISEDEEEEEPEQKTSIPTHGSKPSSKSVHLSKPKLGRESTNNHTSQKPAALVSHQKQSFPSRNIPVNENLLVCGPGGEDDESGDEVEAAHANPFDRIMKQVHKKRPASHQSVKPSKRMRIDSEEEEEEDSDMDDFIDDGDDPTMDVSREIQALFGYDRNKFKHEREDDLSDMEANFSTVMAEEKRSAKLGLMEDLEDMRREEEELRLKAARKKKLMRKGK